MARNYKASAYRKRKEATAQSKRATKNEKSSPTSFLSLPAEIRNDIYNLAFGDDIVHVTLNSDRVHPKGWWFDTYVCLASQTTGSTAKQIRTAKQRTEIVPFAAQHQQCGHATPNSTSWYESVRSALGQHESISNDAMALPWTLNTFIFDNIEEFRKFQARLKPYQRDSLTHIILNIGTIPLDLKQLYKPRSLPGLASLSIFYDQPEINSETWEDVVEFGGDLTRLRQVSRHFHGGKIKKVEVYITSQRGDKTLVMPDLLSRSATNIAKKIRGANKPSA